MTFNVNGVRAILKKGFLEMLHEEAPELVFLQEIKAQVDQLGKELLEHEHYKTYWNPAERKGYSGTALFTRITPDKVENGIENPEFDIEGRVIKAVIGKYSIYGIYFPNGGSGPERLDYKMRFSEYMIDVFNKERAKGQKIISCGDFNVAHNEIDLARPKANVNNSGFLPMEREWFTKLLENGYVDVWRHLNPETKDVYTWWDQRFRARDNNVGWRIDYFVVSEDVVPDIKGITIRNDLRGSDHCPVVLELK